MLRRLPAKQLLLWQSFDLVEPFPDRRSTWHSAQIAAMIAAQGGQKNVKVSDYLLEFGELSTEKPGKTWQQLKFIAKQWVAACKPREKKRGRNIRATRVE